MKKRLLIILLAAVLLSGVSLGALYFFAPGMLGLHAEKEAAAAPPEPEKPPQIVKPATINLDTFGLPVVIGGKISRQIHVSVTLVVKPESFTAVENMVPIVRNAIIQESYDFLPRQFENGGQMDLVKLKATLLQVVRRAVGGDSVQDLLIQAYFEQ